MALILEQPTILGTGMPRLESNLQCSCELRSLDLHVIPQHQLLGIGMQVDLLLYPRRTRHAHPVGQWMVGQSTPTAPRIPQIETLSP
jgi:hypothetical protein